jgi:hypothetical protein
MPRVRLAHCRGAYSKAALAPVLQYRLSIKDKKWTKVKCVLCDREAVAGDYCTLHSKACENLTNSYGKWKKALNICWKEYLSEIVMNPLTGQWAKDVAQHLIKTGEQPDVKVS